jgi:hypothetical protein
MSESQLLTVGRIVRYVTADGQHLRAIVYKVWDATDREVELMVVPAGLNDPAFADYIWEERVSYSEGKEPGTWHWIAP